MTGNGSVGGVKDLNDLVAQLHQIFKSDNINIDQVRRLMQSYENRPEEWEKYAHFNPNGITRNLVDSGNGKFNLILVCWEGGHQSTIHDHANCHCFMRQLTGSLNEIRYDWPKDPKEKASLVQTSSFRLNPPEVSYMNDEIGLHRMENASKTERAMSLHLYCPPFDAYTIFNEATSEREKYQVTFWSIYSKKI